MLIALLRKAVEVLAARELHRFEAHTIATFRLKSLTSSYFTDWHKYAKDDRYVIYICNLTGL